MKISALILSAALALASTALFADEEKPVDTKAVTQKMQKVFKFVRTLVPGSVLVITDPDGDKAHLFITGMKHPDKTPDLICGIEFLKNGEENCIEIGALATKLLGLKEGSIQVTPAIK